MKLIPKDALVAEIERTQKRLNIDDIGGRSVMAWSENFKKFIDTLEVKEVDLDFTKEVYAWIKDNEDTCGFFDTSELAKHFFELGLQARPDKELVEEVYSHIDSIKDTADRMTSGNFMHNRAAIKFSANTIAKVLELMGLKVKK